MAFFQRILKGNGRHKKLSEEQALQNSKEAETEKKEKTAVIENEDDVLMFKLKYLGSTVVEKTTGENISTEAVKNILKTAKAAGKKLQRVNIAVSLKGIAVTDLLGNDVFKVSIYRISNCATDPTHRQIFSFISTDETDTMECHAFLCSKRKAAENVTLAVAQSFAAAFEAWKDGPDRREVFKAKAEAAENAKNLSDKENDTVLGGAPQSNVTEEKLIDFDSEPEEAFEFEAFDGSVDSPAQVRQVNCTTTWVCFEDDFVSESTKFPHKVDLIFA